MFRCIMSMHQNIILYTMHTKNSALSSLKGSVHSHGFHQYMKQYGSHQSYMTVTLKFFTCRRATIVKETFQHISKHLKKEATLKTMLSPCFAKNFLYLVKIPTLLLSGIYLKIFFPKKAEAMI